MQAADIENRFAFHPAKTADKKIEHGSVRHACRTLAEMLNAKLPDGREKSLSITALEESMFWANAALARIGNSGERL